MDERGWSQSPEVIHQKIAAFAIAEGWRVKSDRVGYHMGMEKQDSFIIFSTPVGDIRFYSRTKLTQLLGEPWARANNVAGWASLGQNVRRAIEAVVLTYDQKTRPDGSYYLVASTVEQQDGRMDAILNGNP